MLHISEQVLQRPLLVGFYFKRHSLMLENLPANLRCEEQILPGAAKKLGMIHDTDPVQLVHRNLNVVGVGTTRAIDRVNNLYLISLNIINELN